MESDSAGDGAATGKSTAGSMKPPAVPLPLAGKNARLPDKSSGRAIL